MNHAKRSSFLSLLLAGFLANGAAQTGLSIDPTRPAAEWLAAQAPGTAEAAAREAGPGGLQVIVKGATRKFAVIDGQLIRLGESDQGSRLLAIGAQDVLLQKDGVKTELHMNPAVRKKVHQSKPAGRGLESGSKVLNGEGQ